MTLQKSEECDCCQFTTTELTEFPMGLGSRTPNEPMWLCELCANTPASNAYQYPGRYDDHEVLKTLCYVGNAIIAAVKASK